MKKVKVLLLALLISAMGMQAQTDLFNGENLEGWEIYGTEKWLSLIHI